MSDKTILSMTLGAALLGLFLMQERYNQIRQFNDDLKRQLVATLEEVRRAKTEKQQGYKAV